MLDGGQVEGALAEVARLPGAEAGDRWITAAKRYIDARRALDTIETAAIMGQGRDPFPAAAPGGRSGRGSRDRRAAAAIIQRTISISFIAPAGARTLPPWMKNTNVSRGAFAGLASPK